MKDVLAPLWLAFQFLTRLPAPQVHPHPEDLGRSLLAYPLVGLVLGLLLVLAGLALGALPGASPLLVAALVLALWVALTGALHLDGLADTVDARVGSHDNPNRAREIMKDPASGPMAVAAIVLVLLLKAAALVAVAEQGQWLALLVAVVLGRAALLGLFLFAPYIREHGLGSEMARCLPRDWAGAVLLATLALVLALGFAGGLWGVVFALLAAGGTLLALAAFYRRWLGGFTGDTAGAAVELVEVVALVVLVLAIPG